MTPAEFKAIRESMGLSAQWLATAVRVDQRTVRRWEDGKIPLRPDVVALLDQLEQQAAADVARATARARADLGVSAESAATVPDNLAPESWPVLEVPRVDTDITADAGGRSLPASYHRAIAARARRELGGRLHLTYISEPTTTS